ncbi:MAG TPA: methyltransferase [Anaeromyxobacteraceae bacterium]|nr:methyltransferase [Anaeromyxobacteraceae bacterium]
MNTLPEIGWRDASGAERRAAWLGQDAAPLRLGTADDRLKAGEALARVRRGEALVWTGDYHGARQLLAAMGRRIEAGGRASRERDLGALFRAERERRRLEHVLLGRLLVPIAPDFLVPLRRAPDVEAPVVEALGADAPLPGLLPLRELLGMIGAHEWRVKGVLVPALGEGARVHPHYGVFAPVRGEYVDLVARACERWPVEGKLAHDVGTGTGVLALVLAQRGARVVATDIEPRAVACARENVARLGLSARIDVLEADLFAGGRADLVVSNPPWIPVAPVGLLDRAVYDPSGTLLDRIVADLPIRLTPGGEGWIVVSDLAERLGLRRPGHVEALAARVGLDVADVLEAAPSHPRARDTSDPLHAARSREVTRLYRLVERTGRAP